MDTAAAEAEARDGQSDVGVSYITPADITRPRRWRQDSTVSGGSRSEPKVLLLKLRQRVSAKGTTYLSGWMGSAKLVGFKDAELDEHGNEVWSVYAVTPQPRESGR
jgi:hypothetical protein